MSAQAGESYESRVSFRASDAGRSDFSCTSRISSMKLSTRTLYNIHMHHELSRRICKQR